jgi:hypothetical protein
LVRVYLEGIVLGRDKLVGTVRSGDVRRGAVFDTRQGFQNVGITVDLFLDLDEEVNFAGNDEPGGVEYFSAVLIIAGRRRRAIRGVEMSFTWRLEYNLGVSSVVIG